MVPISPRLSMASNSHSFSEASLQRITSITDTYWLLVDSNPVVWVVRMEGVGEVQMEEN